MSLILKIPGLETLDNGLPALLRLDERGAILGRSPTVTWCLPDSSSQISSRHCEISFRDGRYILTDTSTNGTLVNGQVLSAPHVLRTGDAVTIGHYQILTEVEGQAASAESGGGAAPVQSAWDAWGAAPEPAAPQWASPPAPPPPPPPAQPAAETAWPAATAEASWAPPTSPEPASTWDTPATADSWAPAADASPWDSPAPPPPPPASAWSSPVPDVPPAASTDDIWGKLAEGYVVDWARGGFGQPAPAADPLRIAPPAPPVFTDQPAPPPVAERTVPPVAPRPALAPSASAPSDDLLDGFFRQLGVPEDKLTLDDAELLAAAGLLLRRLVAGMVVMLEARARAKSQMGAQGTALQFDGNNPMKFARTPEQALLQLLNPPERGFMSAERAIEDAFVDLQSHQMATLRAMQGALKATLDRFSPDSIRQRAETGGIMAKLFKDSREAALWKAYEKEFSGVVQGSDEAFMDVFSREFRKAYEDLTMRKGG